MSQVGVAACPKCGARYGVQESAVGQTLPCPACGTKFVVQPVARAADDFLPPSVDLAAGGPIVPASRVLDPIVYPHRDIPWVAIAIVAGLCVSLFAIAFGSWKAYQVVAEAVSKSEFDPADLASGVPTNLGTGTSADVADQVAADTAAAVEGAGKVIDRFANAVTDSIEVPKILSDSHERLASERERLKTDYQQIRDEFASGRQGDAAKKLRDLQMRIEDLTIRWYLLPPMTEGERERLTPRLADMGHGFGGNLLDEPDKAFDGEPAARIAAADLNVAERMLAIVAAMALWPAQAEGPVEQQYADAAARGLNVCKHLYSIRSPADIERVSPAVHEETASIRAIAGQVRGGALDLTNLKSMERMSQYMIQIGMVAYVGQHVTRRFGLDLANSSATEEGQLAAEKEAKEFGKNVATLLADYHTAHVAFVLAMTPGRPTEGSPSVATSVSTPGGPTISLPGFGGPGLGMPRGFGPAGFGPPAGFGGPGSVAGFGPRPGPAGFSDASIDADFETRRQAFAQANGADRILTVRATGGSTVQFRALEQTIMRLIRPTSHSMQSIGTRFQMFVVFAGDIERVASAITAGKVINTDAGSRMIEVEFK
ncbi:MAG: zinc-ribbon domain-containing protein [Planctomycetaceae bacterium]|nr:zinc-ribbon domain-containing protein [Planctomycetaceae bacterium]